MTGGLAFLLIAVLISGRTRFIVLTGFMLILGLLIYRVLNVPDAEFNTIKGIPVYEKLALIVILA